MARQLYKNLAGKRLPSVTTILSRFKDSGGLLYWANSAGLDGKTLEEARVPAATAGTIAHSLVEAHINGWERPDIASGHSEEICAMAENAFEIFLKWFSQTHLKIEHTEVSLVSEKHQFGGMLDAIGREGDDLVILDWKTGPLYPDHLLQAAAYRLLWNENYSDHPITGGLYLCRFSRETGDFGQSYFRDLHEEEATFLLMRELYTKIKAVEKRAK